MEALLRSKPGALKSGSAVAKQSLAYRCVPKRELGNGEQ